MTNQFTDEQIKTAARKWIERLDSDAHWARSPGAREKASSERKILEGLLEAAAGVAPQTPSVLESDKRCPHTPKAEWRRRGYCHRCTVEAGWTLLSDQEAMRELQVQPSSTVDEAALIREAKAKALEEASLAYGSGQLSGIFLGRDDYPKAWLRARADEYREGSER